MGSSSSSCARPTTSLTPNGDGSSALLPVIGVVLAVLMLVTYGDVFDYRTETGTRVAILTGLVVSACAVGSLLERRRRLPRKIISACAG